MATVVGLYESPAAAEDALKRLSAMGVPRGDISVAMRSAAGDTTTQASTTAGEAEDGGNGGGAVTGAVGGGVIGGVAGLLLGAGMLAIPGIGPIVAAGPIATALIGAGVGAATGGLIGALVDAGVPEREASLYQRGVERGGVLVTAMVPGDQVLAAKEVLNSTGARDINQDAILFENPNFQYGTQYERDPALGVEGKNEIRTADAPVVSGDMVDRAFSEPLTVPGATWEQIDAKEDSDQMDTSTGIAAGAEAGIQAGALGGPFGATARAAAIGAGQEQFGQSPPEQGAGTTTPTVNDGPSDLTAGDTPAMDR